MDETTQVLFGIYALQWIIILTGIWIYVLSVGGWPFRDLVMNWCLVLLAFFWLGFGLIIAKFQLD